MEFVACMFLKGAATSRDGGVFSEAGVAPLHMRSFLFFIPFIEGN